MPVRIADSGILSEVKRSGPEAEALYKKAIELRPNDWDLRLALGNFYFRQSRYAEAEQAFAEVIRLVPDCYLGYRNLGGAYHMQARFAEASAEYQKALTDQTLSHHLFESWDESLFSRSLHTVGCCNGEGRRVGSE